MISTLIAVLFLPFGDQTCSEKQFQYWDWKIDIKFVWWCIVVVLSPQKSFSLSVVCLYCYGAIVYIAYLYKVKIFCILHILSCYHCHLLAFYFFIFMSLVPTEGPCKADCATRVILGFTKGRNNNSFSVFQPSEVLVLWKIQKIFLWKNMGLLVMMYYSSATLKKKGSSKWRSLACWFNHGRRWPP